MLLTKVKWSILVLLLSSIMANAQITKTGKIETIDSFPSEYVQTRRVDVWLPNGYNPLNQQKYNVLYMHDGQNLFNPATSYLGIAWEVDSVATALIENEEIPPCIIVGIWNTPKRFTEYMPQIPYNYLTDSFKTILLGEGRGEASSDAYLRFIVEELKPYIDSNYNVKADRKHTFIAGSSMGGLISMYALFQYPKVFGGAACLSTHWPVSLSVFDVNVADAFVRYMDEKLPLPNDVKLYFDYGTETLDSNYEPFQQRMDGFLKSKGYTQKNIITKKFEGAAHNEPSWQKRVSIPLLFLMKK